MAALALLAGTIIVSVAVDRAVLLARLDDRIDRELTQEIEQFRRLVGGVDPTTGEPFGEDIAAIFEAFFDLNVAADDEVVLAILDGDPYLRNANAPLAVEEIGSLVRSWTAATEPTRGTSTTPAGDLRWLVAPVRDADQAVVGAFVAGRFPAEERAGVDEAIRVAMIVGAAAFVIAALIAWAIAGRVLAPLRQLTEAAASVNEDDRRRRVEVDGTGELATLARTFNAMLDRIDAAFATQQSFLDDAGHELRTPITVVRGHLEVVDPDAPLPAATRVLLLDELDRMSRIVDDLLTVAQAERADFVVPGPVDIADLTNDIGRKALALGDRHWSVEPDAMIVADLDRQRIIQAWMNLVRNAAQHTAEGDRIVIFARAHDSILELGVADSGEGVSVEDRTRIFERFGRAESTRRTRSDGAGLGLSIASAVAVAHGGAVELRDTPGGGATFTISLPIAEAPADEAGPGDDRGVGHDVPAPTPASAPPPSQEEPWPAS